MRFIWSERKRTINLKQHGLDEAIGEIRVISFRKAAARETRFFFDQVQH